MYGANGLRISELVAKLLALKALHGDVRCIVSGGDYPDDCHGARYNKTEQPYFPRDTVVIS